MRMSALVVVSMLSILHLGRTDANETNVLPFRLAVFVRTSAPPVLDGKLDEPCWERAGKLTSYRLRGGAGPANAQTIGYALWDDANIYLAFHCDEPHMDTVHAALSGDDVPVWLDDGLEIFLVPPQSPALEKYEPRSRSYHLCVNSVGARYDEIGMNSPSAWNGAWQVAASHGAESWDVELAIPLSDLDTTVAEGDVWTVNFHRGRHPERELSSWSEVPLSFHDISNFGRAIFLEEPSATEDLEADPEIVARVLRLAEIGPAVAAARDAVAQANAAVTSLPENEQAQGLGEELVSATAHLGGLIQPLEEMDDAALLSGWQEKVEELASAQATVKRLATSVQAYIRLAEQPAVGEGRVPALLTFVMPAITNAKLDLNVYPEDATPAEEIAMRACPREFEPATFAVYALEDTAGVRVRATDLKGPDDSTIPASRVDIRVVKFWYQGGTSIVMGETVLTPELLLKDDGLVSVNHEEQRNYLRDPKWPRDSSALLPVDIPAGTTKQFWVTVRVPANAPAGQYEGSISIKPARQRSMKMALKLEVLPFELAEPILGYSIYYRARLSDKPTIGSELKSEEQYVAELRNMLEHGVDNPTIYDGMDRLDEVLTLREQAGLPKKPLFFLGRNAGKAQNDEQLEALKRDVKWTLDLAKEHGINEVYFYGIDEATGEALEAERKSFAACQEAGGKVFVACYRGFFDVVGDLLDLPVMSGPEPWHVDEVHALGREMYNYGAPQCGVEEPETYRRNFGLRLWKRKFDGACDYAYQHDFGDGIWDDFDTEGYRDHNMTYQTTDGVVDTIQWEGWREGVDDVRYLSTLLAAIDDANAAGGKEDVVSEAEAWLADLDISGDLDAVRAGMIERILNLQK